MGTVGTYAPYGYAASGRYVADSVGAVHVAKREAEAEPEAEADADAYYNTYGYGVGYSRYGYGLNRGYTTGYTTISRPIVRSYAAPVSSYGYGLSRGYSTGYYGKREADAEPEADALYSSYGYGLGYSRYSPRVYSTGYSTISRPIVRSYAASPIVRSYGYGRGISSYGYGLNRFGLY